MNPNIVSDPIAESNITPDKKPHGQSACFLVIAAFLAAWASTRACALSTFHLFGGLLFLFYLLLGRQFQKWEKVHTAAPIYKITSVIISIFFTLLYLCADYEALLNGLSSRLFQVCHLAIIAAGLFFLFYALLLSFFLWLRDVSAVDIVAAPAALPADGAGTSKTSNIKSRLYNRLPLFSFFFCLLCWLPYLITNYPAVMTVDSLNQYGQIIGELPMSNHHPWVHTQLIHLFYSLGIALTGDAVTGLGFYTIFQMLVMAACFAYLMDTFVRLHIRYGICLAVLAFYALLPYNGIYMVTMWKDILFSGMTLLFSTVLFRFLMHSIHDEFPISRRTGLLYLLSGFGMCLLRSNGFYAFLLTLPFLFFTFRSMWKRLLLLNAVLLFTVLFVKGPLMQSQQVASSDFVESLSIPVQLMARVYADQEPVSEAADEMWNRIMDTSQIPEVYQSFCSDHMKNLIRQGDQAYLTAHKAEYLRLWVQFGMEHPAAYLRGYIDATKGYWYPDVPNLIGSDERIAPNPYGLTARPLLHNPLTIKIREIVFKLPDMVPVYGLLFSLGAMFWLCIILGTAAGLQNGRRLLIVFLPNAAIMATLFLATPVYNEFRYAYSLLLTLPLFWLCALYRTDSCS